MFKTGTILCLVLLITVIGAWGTEYYVSTSGGDANAGTEAAPFKTIQKAADTAVAGDTVYILAGSYNERVVPVNSGSSGNYITYSAYQNDIVTIDGSGIRLPDDWGGLFDLSELSYIKVIGLKVRDAGPSDNHCGFLVDGGSYITIRDCSTYNTKSSGIGVWNSSNITIDGNEVNLACNDGEQECITVAGTDTFEIKNNHVHHNGAGTIGGEGIDAKDGVSNGKIFNNRVHDLNDRLGIYVDSWDKHSYNIEVYNNIVYNVSNADGFTVAAEAGGLLENIWFYNNIAYNNGVCGMTISRNGHVNSHPMQKIYVINNTFYNNGNGSWGGGLAVDNPSIQGTVVIRNNIFSQNQLFQIEVEDDVTQSYLTIEYNVIHGYRNYDEEVKGSNPVEADPKFTAASTADFTLQSGSPAIDAAVSTDAPSTDYAGTARPQGSGYDIGAYEYSSGGGGGEEEPEIALSRTSIFVGALEGSTQTIDRSFYVSNSGTGTLDWTAAGSLNWIGVSPASGSGVSEITVTLDPTGLAAGTYSGTVSVSSTTAANSPQTVAVSLNVVAPAADAPPFGGFDSPQAWDTVMSSIPVTGWALDDTGVSKVEIRRSPLAGEGSLLMYIGEALFVEGVRTDIEALYPDYPGNTRAGWGYMMLTNFLPNGGNGSFTLHAIATDSGGKTTTLASKTITCDNANAVKPFGAIDTPAPGATVSGSSFSNWGWVLTPVPNSIPTDGSTLTVYVDGVLLGNVTYNMYRSDIATLFPGYANSDGAIGHYALDTTQLEDGMRQLFWIATDSAGNGDGIGSRYIFVRNGGSSRTAPTTSLAFPEPQKLRWKQDLRPVTLKKGFNPEAAPSILLPSEKGEVRLKTRLLERMVIHLPPNAAGYLEVKNSYRSLPVGSTLDREKGIFYWVPGPGCWGEYRLVFFSVNSRGETVKKAIRVTVGD